MDEQLNYIRSLVLQMGELVEKTISSAAHILLKKTPNNKSLTEELKTREEKINNLQLKVARLCFKMLARQSPVAGDLRFILAITNTNTDLERMGDLAFNIGNRAQFIQKDPILDEATRLLFKKMFKKVSNMVRKSLDAFVSKDDKQARQILIQDDEVNHIRNKIRSTLEDITVSYKHLIKTGIDLIIMAGELERIADHTTNIAEEIIFLKTGDDIRHQDVTDFSEETDKKHEH